MKLQANQWPELTQEGISVVEDLVEFENDDIDNIVQNLRRSQNIVHAEILHVPAVLPQPHIDARTKKQAPYVLSSLSVKKIEMAGQLDRHYAGVGRALTKENMTYVILKNYSDHFRSAKALRKDQDIKLMKVQKETVSIGWFETADTFWNAYIGTD